MSFRASVVWAGPLALGLAAVSCAAAGETRSTRPPADAGGYRISGPYAHENLTLFLIHGEEKLKDGSFLTLQEALEQKKAVVYETGDVNELAVENVSPDRRIFIQSGDIVKGGQQDRVIAIDLVVPPRSGRIPIASFCVEHGRWSGRGGEAAGFFGSSADRAASKALKLAVQRDSDQAQVWSRVSEAQAKLSASVGDSVRSPASESSFQLTLENEKVRETADGYIRALSPLAEGRSDVIGYAFAVNGKLNSAEVYASRALFIKLWPKLLKASAVEAVAELQGSRSVEPVTVEAVRACMIDAEKGHTTAPEVGGRARTIRRETARTLLFETRDERDGGAWLHRSYVAK